MHHKKGIKLHDLVCNKPIFKKVECLLKFLNTLVWIM